MKMLFTSKEVKVKDSLGGFCINGEKCSPILLIGSIFGYSLRNHLSNIGIYEYFAHSNARRRMRSIFLLYEMLRGKPLPEKVQQYAQSVGMFIILGLLLFANGMDLIRAFFIKIS